MTKTLLFMNFLVFFSVFFAVGVILSFVDGCTPKPVKCPPACEWLNKTNDAHFQLFSCTGCEK